MSKLSVLTALLTFIISTQAIGLQRPKPHFMRPANIASACYPVGTLFVQPPGMRNSGRLYRIKSLHYKTDGSLEGCVSEPVDQYGKVVPLKERARRHPSVKDLE